MLKKTVIVLTCALAIAGCGATFHVTKRPNQTPISPKFETVYSPEINKENSVELGETMISKSYRKVYPAIKLNGEVVFSGPRADGINIEIQVPSGIHKALMQDAEGIFFSMDSKFSGNDGKTKLCMPGFKCLNAPGGIFVPNNNPEKTEVFFIASDSRQPVNYDKPSIQFSKTTFEEWTDSSFKRELTYTGISGNTISIVYKEFKDDHARPAFSQELKYDLSQGREIGYKGARFEVISANNVAIRYKVIKSID